MNINLTPSQLEIYRKSARVREQQLRRELHTRHRRAWKLAHQAARILRDEFGASRVVLFGSLLKPDIFHKRSDVDLAIWDIQGYFRAVARLIDLDPEINFDLVPFEDARPGILEVIQRGAIDL